MTYGTMFNGHESFVRTRKDTMWKKLTFSRYSRCILMSSFWNYNCLRHFECNWEALTKTARTSVLPTIFQMVAWNTCHNSSIELQIFIELPEGVIVNWEQKDTTICWRGIKVECREVSLTSATIRVFAFLAIKLNGITALFWKCTLNFQNIIAITFLIFIICFTGARVKWSHFFLLWQWVLSFSLQS